MPILSFLFCLKEKSGVELNSRIKICGTQFMPVIHLPFSKPLIPALVAKMAASKLTTQSLVF